MSDREIIERDTKQGHPEYSGGKKIKHVRRKMGVIKLNERKKKSST